MPTVAVNWLRSGAIPAGVIIAWVGTNASIPVGWTRVTSLDGRFVKQIATSGTAPGATGGASTHLHPFQQHSGHTFTSHVHTGSWGTSPPFTANSGGIVFGGTGLTNTHDHTSSDAGSGTLTVTNNSAINTDTAANDPLHVTVIFIQSNGSPAGIPVNGVVWFNGAAPTGFAVLTALDNRLMKGAAGGADGGTSAGADTHTHTVATHTHPITNHTHVVSLNAGGLNDRNRNGATTHVATGHPHTLGTSTTNSAQTTTDAATETTGNGDVSPPWQKMRAIQKTSNVGTRPGIIAIWLGTLATIPSGWKLCDGTAGTPNLSQDKYVKGAATDGEVGNTGGAATHTHAAGTAHSHTTTGTHSHTFTGASGSTSTADSGSGGSLFYTVGHAHVSATYTAPSVSSGTSSTQATAQSANTSNDPVFTGVAYIQLI